MTDDQRAHDEERPAPDSLRGKLRGVGRPNEELDAVDGDPAAADADPADVAPPPEPKRPTDPPF